MFEAGDIREWRGHGVVDSGGHKIGTLESASVDHRHRPARVRHGHRRSADATAEIPRPRAAQNGGTGAAALSEADRVRLQRGRFRAAGNQ